ncbi:hypothetical protein R1sor_013217 [Riccia sorocarpa]|uniref:Uncharacterized protein n=1 Tax=Riccia sorocarpa TaxID=122646 RepID=A0ABD3H629_9MARC
MVSTVPTASVMTSSLCSPTVFRFTAFNGAFTQCNSRSLVTRAAVSKFPALCLSTEISDHEEGISRREALMAAAVTAFGGSLGTGLVLPQRSDASEQAKQTNLSIEDVKKIIEEDFITRDYLVTGDMTFSIYNENCRFNDPTTKVSGVEKYSKAVKSLFDPKGSKTDLVNIEVSGPRSIDVKYILTGFLNLPWHPYIAPYEANARYTLGEDGLIESYDEEWSISLLEAFTQMLTPSSFRKDAPKV